MNLQQLRETPHLSASAINAYVDCGLSYRFSKIDKIKPEFISDALVFGTVIHRVLEFFHHQRMIGDKASLIELTNLFEDKWREAAEDNQNIQYKEGTSFDSLLMSGKSLLAAYYTELPEVGFKVLALEEAFSFIIPGVPLPIIGAMDMIEEDDSGTVVITDHKTTAKLYSSNEVDSNFQLTLYFMAAKANGFANREILLKFDCLVKTQKPKLAQYYTVRSEEDETRAIRKVQAVWEGITKAVFVPNDGSWKCKGCCYQEHCKQWFQGR